MTTKKINRTLKSIRLEDEVIIKVESMGSKENRSFTNMVETILKKYFRLPPYNNEKVIP